MNLKEFLEKEGESVQSFAKRSGMSVQNVYRIISGRHGCRLEHARKIVAATKLRVTLVEAMKKIEMDEDYFRSKGRPRKFICSKCKKECTHED